MGCFWLDTLKHSFEDVSQSESSQRGCPCRVESGSDHKPESHACTYCQLVDDEGWREPRVWLESEVTMMRVSRALTSRSSWPREPWADWGSRDWDEGLDVTFEVDAPGLVSVKGSEGRVGEESSSSDSPSLEKRDRRWVPWFPQSDSLSLSSWSKLDWWIGVVQIGFNNEGDLICWASWCFDSGNCAWERALEGALEQIVNVGV